MNISADYWWHPEHYVGDAFILAFYQWRAQLNSVVGGLLSKNNEWWLHFSILLNEYVYWQLHGGDWTVAEPFNEYWILDWYWSLSGWHILNVPVLSLSPTKCCCQVAGREPRRGRETKRGLSGPPIMHRSGRISLCGVSVVGCHLFVLVCVGTTDVPHLIREPFVKFQLKQKGKRRTTNITPDVTNMKGNANSGQLTCAVGRARSYRW